MQHVTYTWGNAFPDKVYIRWTGYQVVYGIDSNSFRVYGQCRVDPFYPFTRTFPVKPYSCYYIKTKKLVVPTVCSAGAGNAMITKSITLLFTSITPDKVLHLSRQILWCTCTYTSKQKHDIVRKVCNDSPKTTYVVCAYNIYVSILHVQAVYVSKTFRKA